VKAADTGESFWMIMLSALIVFAVVQTIQDTILTPKIMGHVTGLNPAIILLSLSIWGSLLGILGMVIALPMTTLLITYYQRYVIKNKTIEKSNKS
jgi:predicted PurR-regulated permease PerM